MTIIKTERSKNLLVELEGYKYNPNKRFQYCKTYQNKEGYIENIKEEFDTLWKCLIAMVVVPFGFIIQIYKALQSLFPYSLVITKKNLIKEIENEH